MIVPSCRNMLHLQESHFVRKNGRLPWTRGDMCDDRWMIVAWTFPCWKCHNKKAAGRILITACEVFCSWCYRGNTAAYRVRRKYIDRKVEGWTKSLICKIGRFFYCFRHFQETYYTNFLSCSNIKRFIYQLQCCHSVIPDCVSEEKATDRIIEYPRRIGWPGWPWPAIRKNFTVGVGVIVWVVAVSTVYSQ